MAALVVSLVWAALALFARPGWAGRPLDTEDTGTLDPGKMELELSVGLAKEPGALFGLGAGVLNLGIVPRLELTVELAAAHLAREGGPDHAGVGDLVLGAKYRLLDETEAGPALLANVKLRLPTGDSDVGLGAPGVDVLARLAASKTFGPLTVTGNAGYTFVTADRSLDVWLVSAAAEYQVTAAWTVVAEVVSFFRARAGPTVVGTGLTRATPDLVATAGITIGF